VKDSRPVNLDLTKFKFPLPAITSILHRISGVLIFFGIAILLYLLDLSLRSPEGFSRASDWLVSPLVKFVVWVILSGLFYHLIAGIKHLTLDLGLGETTGGARASAMGTLVLAGIAAVIAGVWLW